MPTPTRAKPPVPAWIIRERKRLGLKPRDLAERLSAAGLPVTEGTVRTWEAGRNPHPDNVEGLERIFGTRSPDHMAGTEDGDTSLVPALLAELRDYAALVRELVAQNAELMQRVTLERPPAWVAEARAQYLDSEQRRLQESDAAPGDRESPEPEPEPATAGRS